MKLVYATWLALAVSCTSATASTLLTFSDEEDVRQFTTLVDVNTGAGVQTLSDSTSSSNISGPSLTISQFDPSLGVLNSIAVNWSMVSRTNSPSTSFTCRDTGLINTDCEAESFSAESSATVATDLPGFGTLVIVDSRAGEKGTYTVAPSDFGMFTGTGSINVAWRYSFSHSITGKCDPNLGTIIDICEGSSTALFDFESGIEVIYDYRAADPSPTPVPVPASGLLLLGGLAAFSLRRRS